MTTIPERWHASYVPLYDRLARPKAATSFLGGTGYAYRPYRPMFLDAVGTIQPATFTEVQGGFEDALAAARVAAKARTSPSPTWAVFHGEGEGPYFITPMGAPVPVDAYSLTERMVPVRIDRRHSRFGARVVKTTVPYEAPRHATDVDALVGREVYFDLRGSRRDVTRTRF